MAENENKRMRYFHELNSEEQAEKIALLQRMIDELLSERVRAALGLDPAARAREMGQAHCRYRWTSDQVPHDCGSHPQV